MITENSAGHAGNNIERFKSKTTERIRQLAEQRGLGEWQKITSQTDNDTTDLDDLMVAVDKLAGVSDAVALLMQTFGPDVLDELAA